MTYKELDAAAHEIAAGIERTGCTVHTAKLILDAARQEIENNSVAEAKKEEPPTAATEGGNVAQSKDHF